MGAGKGVLGEGWYEGPLRGEKFRKGGREVGHAAGYDFYHDPVVNWCGNGISEGGV